MVICLHVVKLYTVGHVPVKTLFPYQTFTCSQTVMCGQTMICDQTFTCGQTFIRCQPVRLRFIHMHVFRTTSIDPSQRHQF